MSKNPRQRQGENEACIKEQEKVGNNNIKCAEEADEHDQENHHEESNKISTNINEENMILAHNDDNFNDVNDHDGNNDSNDDNHLGGSDNNDYEYIHCEIEDVKQYDDNDDDDDSSVKDCHLQRLINDQEVPIDVIMELIEIFPLEIQHKNLVSGNYPLHTACSCGNYAHRVFVATKLIEVFPEAVQHKNSEGLYPLHLAILSDQPDSLVMQLIEIYPDAVRQSTMYGTALHFTCSSYLSDIVLAKLIEIYPQAIKEEDNSGKYPMQCFGFTSNRFPKKIAFAKILLDRDLLDLGIFSNGKILLQLASETYNFELVKYIMQRSDLMIHININLRSQNGRTQIHYACCKSEGHEVVEMLLHHPDIDVNVRDRMNDTPLHEAVLSFVYHDDLHYSKVQRVLNNELFVNIVQKLLDHPFILINEKNSMNKTPLDYMKAHIYDLKRTQYNIQNKLQCAMTISNLLEEFSIQKRFQAYCYHIKNFVVDKLVVVKKKT